MDCNQENDFIDAAEFQLWSLSLRCPCASSILENVRCYGSKALFQVALTVGLYKSILDLSKCIPDNFDYYCLIEDYPQVRTYLDQAINSVIEDWLEGART